MQAALEHLVVPDLGMPGIPIILTVWLVPLGAHVTEGDRVVELLAGDATVDVAAPLSGVLSERRVREDELVVTGQVLGSIRRLCPDEERL
jgi:pyruvate/2-oxoglutarate dehydrogenase complex dihydrolipoamide acyltransferase (E2) component